MKDLHHNTKSVRLINETVTSGGGAVNSGDIDRQGFNSQEFLVDFGANLGDTLSGSNYFTVALTHADDDGTGAAGSYTAVAAADVLGATPDANGVVVTVDDAAEDEALYQFGYKGNKRFTKLTITPVGTLTNGNPVTALLVKGDAENKPTQ